MSVDFKQNKKSEILTLKLNTEHKKIIALEAKKNKVSVSHFVRSVVLDYIKKQG